MAQLDLHVSGKTQVLELLFPNGAWRELVAAIVWEVADGLFQSGTTFRFKVWVINVTVPQPILEMFLTALFGPRPAR